jgi:polar amino acid transport system ATP-binding protein
MQLELHQITKRFGATTALDAINCQLPRAHVLVLIGPSGSGKSTLLRLLGGLTPADEGSIRINGQEVPHDEASLSHYRQQNGFLFQQFNLFPHLTVQENVALPLRLVHRKNRAEAARVAQQTLEKFDLAGLGPRRPHELSGGQQQRVGLARAIAARPQMLFLDEPTSALDPEMTSDVLDLIRQLAEAGQDIVLSTHEMGFARAVADQVLFIDQGQLVEQGAPEQIFHQPQSVSLQRFLSKVMKY